MRREAPINTGMYKPLPLILGSDASCCLNGTISTYTGTAENGAPPNRRYWLIIVLLPKNASLRKKKNMTGPDNGNHDKEQAG